MACVTAAGPFPSAERLDDNHSCYCSDAGNRYASRRDEAAGVRTRISSPREREGAKRERERPGKRAEVVGENP